MMVITKHWNSFSENGETYRQLVSLGVCMCVCVKMHILVEMIVDTRLSSFMGYGMDNWPIIKKYSIMAWKDMIAT